MSHQKCHRKFLKLSIVDTDGGTEKIIQDKEIIQENDISNVLKADNTVYCSEKPRNVNIILALVNVGEIFTITDITVIVPSIIYTAPVKNGLVWVLDEKPKLSDFDMYDNFGAKEWESLDLKQPRQPDSYFEMDPDRFDITVSLLPKSGKYIFLKLLDRKDLRKEDTIGKNIDIQEFIAWGYLGIFNTEIHTHEISYELDNVYKSIENMQDFGWRVQDHFLPLLAKYPDDEILNATYVAYCIQEGKDLIHLKAKLTTIRNSSDPIASAIVAYDTKNWAKAFSIFNHMSTYHISQLYLSFLFLDGKYLAKDEKESKRWLELGVSQGNIRCINIAGSSCYFSGDNTNAMEYFKMGINLGSINAKFRLAWNLEELGEFNEAFQLYEAIASIHVGAKRELGKFLCDGKGCDKDQKRSHEILLVCSNQGDLEATLEVGKHYMNGIGCEVDLEKSYELYRKVADSSNQDLATMAHCNLGHLYRVEDFILYDLEKSFQHTKIAYHGGSTQAIEDMGRAYEMGYYGGDPNLEKALQYFKKALAKNPDDTNMQEACGRMKDLLTVTKSDFEIELWRKEFLARKIVIEITIDDFLPIEDGKLEVIFTVSPEIPIAYDIELIRDGISVNLLKSVKEITSIKDTMKENGKFGYKIVIHLLETVIESSEYQYDFDESFYFTRNVLDRYQIIKKLVFKGSFGLVFLAKDIKFNEKVVIKKIRCESFGEGNLDSLNQHLYECATTLRLDHPNIVKARDIFFDVTDTDTNINGYMNIVMKHFVNSDLTAYLRKNKDISMKKMISFAVQIACGLEYLHGLKMIHRDLKPDNIFVDEDEICCIGDFGLLCEVDGVSEQGSCGTSGYIAPEVQNGEVYSTSADMYSFGSVLYFIMFGKLKSQDA